MELLEAGAAIVVIVATLGMRAWRVVHHVRRTYERLRPIKSEDRERRRRERAEQRVLRAERQRIREAAMRRYGPRDQRQSTDA